MKIKYIILILGFLCASGCTSVMYNINPNVATHNDESIIFGRLDINVKSRARILLNFKNTATGKRYSIQKSNWITPLGPNKNEDALGYFITTLPPGDYKCFRIDQQKTNGMIYSIKINYPFNVSSDSDVYLGTLHYQELKEKNYILFGKSRIHLEGNNDIEETIKYFKKNGYRFDRNIVENILGSAKHYINKRSNEFGKIFMRNLQRGADECKKSMTKLEYDMTSQEVIELIGKPIIHEYKGKNDESIVVFFYATDYRLLTRGKCWQIYTPVVFENNRLTGWSWTHLENTATSHRFIIDTDSLCNREIK